MADVRRLLREPVIWIPGLIGVLLLTALGWFGTHTREKPAPVVLAFAGSLTGPMAAVGNEALAMTQIYLGDVNAAGGIDGHPAELLIFDDKSDPATARANAAAILESPAVAVLGHSAGTTAAAAAPAYRDGHIPAVTAHTGQEDVTRANPWYFRTMPANGTQATFLALYIRTVVLPRLAGTPEIDLVTDGNFEAAYRRGLEQGAPRVQVVPFALTGDANAEAEANDVAQRLAGTTAPRIVVIGTEMDRLPGLVKAIRRHGIRSTVILPPGAASDAFGRALLKEPEEQARPGALLDNTFAMAPVIMDASGLYGQALASRYLAKTGLRAGWFTAGAQDAVRLTVTAIRDAKIAAGTDPKPLAREKLRAALAAIDGPGMAVTGVNGKLFFDANHDMPGPMRYGFFQAGHFVSAPVQMAPVRDPTLIDPAKEIASGHMIMDKGQLYWLQRVVATGIDIVRLNGIDVKAGTFNADLYFWIRYANVDSLPERIEFPGFLGRLDLSRPLRTRDGDGVSYRLWRFSGDFKADYDLHDYPFDTQALTIRMRNVDYPREEIAYAIDTFGLALDEGGKMGNGDAFRELQQWHVLAVRPFTEAFTVASTLGDPALFATASRIEYGGLAIGVIMHRNGITFLIKALLPIFLLSLVVYATLFFPPSLGKERTTIPLTAILTTAVLLVSINNQLPSIGYTVALEYIFYAFFALCLAALLIGLAAEQLRDKTFHHHVVKVDMFGRIIYLIIVAATVGTFVWHYGYASG